MSCSTAREIWNRLKSVHSQKSESCKMVLYQEFYDSKMEPGQKVSEYVSRVEFIARKLKDSGASLDDETLISKIVTGLSQEYKHFMTTWMGTPAAERTYDNLLPRLLAEESIYGSNSKSEAVAMKMNALPDRSKVKKKRNLECYHCHKKGHMKKDCRQLKKEMESGFQDTKKYAVVATSGTGGGQTWFIDSGASYHMTGNIDWVQGYKKLANPMPIRVASSEILYAVGTGSVDVISTVGRERFEVTIQDVMYVPGMRDNLFSQGAADSKGVKFVSATGRINVVCGDKVVMIGQKSTGNNMYILNIQVLVRACIAREERSQEEWHRVLGHLGMSEIENLNRQGCTIGFKIAREHKQDVGFTGCCQGKAHRVSHPESQRERATEVLERVHVDLVGPVSPSSLGGSRYFMLIRDELSTYLRVYFMPAKSEVPSVIKGYINEASVQTQRRVRIIRSDNGTEFRNKTITQICQAEGILQEFSAAYTPQQNGEIERSNRTVIESARAMLQASRLPVFLWGEAILTAVYLRNRLTNKRTREKTPFEIFHGKVPAYSHLVEFGREAQVLDKQRGVSKFDAKTTQVFVVGYSDRINTYRCYDAEKKDVMVTSDLYLAPHAQALEQAHLNGQCTTFVIIDHTADHMVNAEEQVTCEHSAVASESVMADQVADDQIEECSADPSAVVIADVQPSAPPPTPTRSTSLSPETAPVAARVTGRQPDPVLVIEQTRQHGNRRHHVVARPVVPPTSQRPTVVPERVFTPPVAHHGTVVRQVDWRPTVIRQDANPSTAQSHADEVSTQSTSSQVARQRPVATAGATRLSGALSPSSIMRRLAPMIGGSTNKDLPHDQAKGLVAMSLDHEPANFLEALSAHDADKWRVAIKEELDAHAKNGTWQIVPKLPHMKEITARWLFKIKDDGVSSDKRYKGRLVARGFSLKAGVDYADVFAPVVRMDSIRLLFSLCAQYKLNYKQFDVTTAFLNGEVKEELYLTPPEGLEVPEGHTCKLIRSLYGLKQSPRCWNSKFTEMITKFGLKPTHSDPCVYVSNDEPPVYLALYVDDSLVFAKTNDEIDKVLGYLKEHFMIKLVNSSYFLGLEIVRDSTGSIFLHQKRYIERMLQKYIRSKFFEVGI